MATTKPRLRARKTSREPLSLFPETTRWCPQCSQHLPRDAFNQDQKNRDGLASRSRECSSATKRAAYTPAIALRFSERHRQRTYSLSPDAFDAMVAAQQNRCAICARDMGSGKKRHVDHCHETGRIRALLCHHCNTALGHADDRPDRLRAMANYIERYRLSDDTT